MSGSEQGNAAAGPNPFVGPRPFERGEKLYGRDREVRDLYYLLNAERVVVLHSPSGAGKSSLVQAGLVPRLKEAFDVWGPTRVNQESAAAVNRYVQSALVGFEEDVPEPLRRSPEVLAGQTLAEYFAARPRRRSAPAEAVLLFDQFEEILTADPLAVAAKEAFFDQLGELLRNPRVWALFILREEYLAPLDPYVRRLPTQLQNRFRIDLLSPEAAKEAMVAPARDGGRAFPAADQLIRDLATVKLQQADGSFHEVAGRHVEPMHLQVVCRQMWDEMPPGELSIDPENLAQFGDVDEALGAYYASSVRRIADPEQRIDETDAAARARKDVRGRPLGLTVMAVLDFVHAGLVLCTPWLMYPGLIDEYFSLVLLSLVSVRCGVGLWRMEARGHAAQTCLAVGTYLLSILVNAIFWAEADYSWERILEYVLEDCIVVNVLALSAFVWVVVYLWRGSVKTLFTAGRPTRSSRKEGGSAVALSRERAIRDWFSERLITAGGVRGQVLRGRKASGGLDNEWIPKLLDTHLVRAEKRAGATWYELAHDRLVGPVQKENAAWQQSILSPLQRAAKLWANQGRPPGLLLQRAELARGERWARRNPEWLTNDDRDFLAVSLAARRQVRWVRGLAMGASLVALVAIGMAWIAWKMQQESQNLMRMAIAGREISSGYPTHGALAALEVQKVSQTFDGIATLHEALAKNVAITSFAANSMISFRSDGAIFLTTQWVWVGAALEGFPEYIPSVRMWDTSTFQEVPLDLPSFTYLSILDLSFGPGDRPFVVTTYEGRFIKIWDALSGAETSYLGALAEKVVGASFSPGGSLLATISEDDTVRIWEVSTGAEIAILDKARAIFFSPGGRHAVTVPGDHTARVWNVVTGEGIATLSGHDDKILSVSFDSEGTRAVTTSADRTARIWDVSSGKGIVSLVGHRGSVESASFSPDNTVVVTASLDKTARIWNVATGEGTVVLNGHTGPVITASFSPDGSRVVTASADKTARIWRASTGEETSVLTGYSIAVTAASFSPDGSFIVTRSGNLEIWDVQPNRNLGIHFLSGHEALINAASFSPDGSRVVTVSEDKSARIWSASTGEELLILRGHTDGIEDVSFSPDGSRAVTASRDKTARIWNVLTGEEDVSLEGHTDSVWDAAFSPDGSRVVTASEDTTARIWNAVTGEKLAALTTHTGSVRSASFSPDGSRVVTASEDTTARVWNVLTGEEMIALTEHSGTVRSASFSSDGLCVATASGDGTARIWDAATGDEIHVLRHERGVNGVSFSPDGTRVVTASWDRTARVWNVLTGEEIAVLRGHDKRIYSASFSPNGGRIVTAAGDDTARIWDARTGEELGVLPDKASLTHASFSPDGTRVLTTSLGSTARIWSVTANLTRVLQSRIRSRTRKCIPFYLRSQYFGESWPTSMRNADACKACVPVYFERLGDPPPLTRENLVKEWRAIEHAYLEAWDAYQECLERER